MTDAATKYAQEVVAGERLAGQRVIMACERHLRDLERDDLLWDPDAVERSVAFYRDVLRLPETGEQYLLSPHYQFIAGNLYGWRKLDGTLRFQFAYIEVAKGDGKTPFAAGIALRALCFEGQRGAQIYSGASGRDQALLMFRDAVAMAKASPAIMDRVKISGKFPHEHSLADPQTASFFHTVSADKSGKSGQRVYRGLLDEIHEHKDSTVLDFMDAGTKSTPNSFILAITNSGHDRMSVCWREHEYSRKVLEGSLEDDARFAFIAGLDPCERHRQEGKEFPVEDCEHCDDWRDPDVWPKANPNLGTTIDHPYLERQVTKATGMASKRNLVKRLNFCVWTEQADSWIPVDEWLDCKREALVRPELLHGRRAICGVDLAYTDDISAVVLYFPSDGEDPGIVLPYFWVPKENVVDRVKKDKVPYDRWIEEGLIETTPGKVTDYSFLRQRIVELSRKYEIGSVPFDPSNAIQLATELQNEDDLPVVLFPQGCKKFSPAMTEAERLVRSQQIAHDGNEVLTWMMGNVAPYENAQGERKPDKKRSREKIDGVVALLMAIAMATETSDDGADDAEVIIL